MQEGGKTSNRHKAMHNNQPIPFSRGNTTAVVSVYLPRSMQVFIEHTCSPLALFCVKPWFTPRYTVHLSFFRHTSQSSERSAVEHSGLFPGSIHFLWIQNSHQALFLIFFLGTTLHLDTIYVTTNTFAPSVSAFNAVISHLDLDKPVNCSYCRDTCRPSPRYLTLGTWSGWEKGDHTCTELDLEKPGSQF